MSSFFMTFPELSDAQIAEAADGLLAEYAAASGWERVAPVPVESIAEHHLGYDIDISDEGLFADPDYLGGIVFDQQMIQINASVEANEGRYNFTVAHEIGHHVLHRALFIAQRRDGIDDIMCRDVLDKPIEEQQADKFAAALLMPADLVMHAVATLGDQAQPRSVAAARGYAARVIRAGRFSNVSVTAMVNRLIDLGITSGVRYQRGTGHDFARHMPSGLRSLLWNLYSRYRRRRRRR